MTRYWLLLAEGHLTRRLFGAMVQRGPEGTPVLPVPAGGGWVYTELLAYS
jgi:hypothetical protein